MSRAARGADRLAGLRSQVPPFPPSCRRAQVIEVQGPRQLGNVEINENEWARTRILREQYWLYVVFDSAPPRARLVRVRDPFTKLLVRNRNSTAYTISLQPLLEAAE